MKFVYKPEGADALSWEFDPDKMKSSELILIEEMTGWTSAEWADHAERGSIKAVHALLYVFLKRDRPTLTAEQVPDFTMDELDFEDDKPAPKARKRTATASSA